MTISNFDNFLIKRKNRLTAFESRACKKINKGLIRTIRKNGDIRASWEYLLKRYLPESSIPKLLDCPDIPYEIYYSQIKEGRPHLFLIFGLEVAGDILFLDEEQFNIFDQKIVNININNNNKEIKNDTDKTLDDK